MNVPRRALVELITGIFVVGSLQVALAAPPGLVDELRLLNGDRVHGAIEDMEADAVRFLPRWGNNTVAIPGKYLGYVLFNSNNDTRKRTLSKNTGEWIQLTNGDRFIGGLESYTTNRAEVVTSWGQTSELDSQMLRSITFMRATQAILVEGVGDSRAWNRDANRASGAVVVSDGVAYFNRGGRFVREIPNAPRMTRVQFSITAMDGNYYYRINPLNPRGSSSSASVHINVNSNGASVFTPSNARRRSVPLTGIRFPRKPNSEIRFDAFIDGGNGKMTLYVDGIKQKPIDVPAYKGKFDGKNPARFEIQTGSVGGALTHFRVSTWDGMLAPEVKGELPSNYDEVRLRNGDLLVGTLLTKDEKDVSILTEAGKEVTMPVDSVSGIHFATQNRYVARRQSRDVEVRFGARGERLTLALDSMDQKRISGSSEAWADSLVLPRESLELIRFNLYLRRRLDNLSFDRDWLFTDSPVADPMFRGVGHTPRRTQVWEHNGVKRIYINGRKVQTGGHVQ